MQAPDWFRRVPLHAWFVPVALLVNAFTTILWPAIASLWCQPRRFQTTTVHPNGTTEPGSEWLGCDQSFTDVLATNFEYWWFEAIMFPLFGQHLFFPGHYDASAWLGWIVWALSLVAFGGALWLGRNMPLASLWWRIPLAYLVAGILSGSGVQEWEHFD